MKKKLCIDCKHEYRNTCNEARNRNGIDLVTGQLLPITSFPCHNERSYHWFKFWHCSTFGWWYKKKE